MLVRGCPNLPDECCHASSSSGSERDAVLDPNSPVPGGWSLDRAHIVPGPRRTMPHMSRKEWYDVYLHREPQPAGGTKASQRTFERMYRGWKKHLRIAKIIQLGKCVTCEQNKEQFAAKVFFRSTKRRPHRASVYMSKLSCVIAGLII